MYDINLKYKSLKDFAFKKNYPANRDMKNVIKENIGGIIQLSKKYVTIQNKKRSKNYFAIIENTPF